jgi:hypothetical protein
MSSCNRLATEERAPLPHERTELHCGVATDARTGGLTSQIGADKRFQHCISELALEILNMERDLQLIGNASSVISCIKRAATLPPAIHTICSIVEAHPHADNLMSGLHQKRRCHR